MHPITECHKCRKLYEETRTVQCEHCLTYWCDDCYKECFFLRKSIYCIVTFRVSRDEYYVEFDKVRNDDFHFACSHDCQEELGKKLKDNVSE